MINIELSSSCAPSDVKFSIFIMAQEALLCCSPLEKVEKINELHQLVEHQFDAIDFQALNEILVPVEAPGRPERPVLVPPQTVPKRGLGTPLGRAALLHAIAHIEFNAMNLALDAIYRFQDLPRAYYVDWLQVAFEEAKHFKMLYEELLQHGVVYGDFTAHNGLWEMAIKTHERAVVRMALVPRLMEARGLDVTPQIIEKFEVAKETRAVEILKIILKEEVGHVKTGNRWYYYLCEREGLDPIPTFLSLVNQYAPTFIRRPLNQENRKAAGFTEEEMALIETLALA